MKTVCNMDQEIIIFSNDTNNLETIIPYSVFLDVYYGCTDQSTSNYNSIAIIDDGSCVSWEELANNSNLNLIMLFQKMV